MAAAAATKRDYDFLFKLVLIGDSGVGKSCLLLRFSVSPERSGINLAIAREPFRSSTRPPNAPPAPSRLPCCRMTTSWIASFRPLASTS